MLIFSFHLVNNRLALPLTFQITNPESENSKEEEDSETPKVVHAGVLDFTAPPNMVYLPLWMMKKLNISEGQPVSFVNVHLPKGEFVKLQPHSQKWLKLEQSTRKSMYYSFNIEIKISLSQFFFLKIGISTP